MKKVKTIIGIVALLFLGSCVTLNEFPIEVFQPAKVTLSLGVKNVTLVSRNLKYTNDTLQNYYLYNSRLLKDKKFLGTDSLSVATCLDSLSLKMMAQKRFGKITVLPFASLPVQHVKNISAPSQKLIRKIASDTNADVLVFLDMYSGFYSSYPNQENGHTIAKVLTASIWTIYDASKSQILNHTSLVDTLYWDGLDAHDVYSSSRIPDKKAALQIAAGLTGVNYSKNIVPNWVKVYRNTLSCNQPDFMKAAELAKKNNWEAASLLWNKYVDSKNKRQQMQALFNLAIASEMNGNVDAAIELITKASKVSSSIFYTTENENIRKYSAVLARRKIELNKINSMNYGL